MAFVAVDALVADVAVLCAFRFYNFAVGTQFIRWNVLHELFHLELGPARSLYVAGIRTHNEDERQE